MARRTVTMDWSGLSDDDGDEDFFESYPRISAVDPVDLCSSGSDDDEGFEDSRMSFASAVSTMTNARKLQSMDSFAKPQSPMDGYDMWMAEPVNVKERRQRLLQGFGIASKKDLMRIASRRKKSSDWSDSSVRSQTPPPPLPVQAPAPAPAPLPPPPVNRTDNNKGESTSLVKTFSTKKKSSIKKKKSRVKYLPIKPQSYQESKRDEEPVASPSPSPSPAFSNPTPKQTPNPTPTPTSKPFSITNKDSKPKAKTNRANLVRSRSYGDMVGLSALSQKRKEELVGSETIQRLIRTSSEELLSTQSKYNNDSSSDRAGIGKRRSSSNPSVQGAFGSALSIKNLDNGMEFEVKECSEQGMWARIRDVQTGRNYTIEEFEQTAGSSPLVKELMARLSGEDEHSTYVADTSKLHQSKLSKRFKNSTKKGVAFLKNIREAATSKKHDHKEPKDPPKEHPKDQPKDQSKDQPKDQSKDQPKEQPECTPAPEEPKQPSNKSATKWIKSRHHGLSHKELTALHMAQEIQAHQGSIWTIKFSCDARLLASAGEDKLIHVWEVQECEVTAPNDATSGSVPVHPMAGAVSERPALAEITPLPSEKRKKIKNYWRKGPDYVNVPETVFALSEKPICTFSGHEEDILDVSWSMKSELLLSSSMDKTVRLWELESQTCLKMFTHNDYVTCLQFNPVDDNYFMSGSLDAKVRIWNIEDHQVVDWIDLHEMVTAATYTPDGQGAVVGSHQGNCRFYSISDCKMECRNCVRMKIKAQAKKIPSFHTAQEITNKITGFQFNTLNPSEVLITSTDSRIRLHNGTELIQKYRGFKNTSSQLWASFSPDGKHVISSSEDSQIYIWKIEESKVPGCGNTRKKSRVTVLAYETFTCKDVSVAIPWPRIIKFDAGIEAPSKRHTGGGKKKLPPIPLPKKVAEEEVGPTEEPAFGGASDDSTTAWGLVIVAASVEGEIRVYQNFGLPLKVGRL